MIEYRRGEDINRAADASSGTCPSGKVVWLLLYSRFFKIRDDNQRELADVLVVLIARFKIVNQITEAVFNSHQDHGDKKFSIFDSLDVVILEKLNNRTSRNDSTTEDRGDEGEKGYLTDCKHIFRCHGHCSQSRRDGAGDLNEQ